ncbi:MAG: DUF2934 domain-containing protein [Polyangia bacterium]
MNTTGRKTVKGEKTSAPKAAKASSKQATESSATASASKTAPSYEAIAKRSYELYLQRGGLDGYHEQDWLQAEAELSSS